MDTEFRKALENHKRALQKGAERGAAALARIADAVRGRWLGPDWSADLAAAYSASEGYPSTMALAQRASLLRRTSGVSDTSRVVEGELVAQSLSHAAKVVADVYAEDQGFRAREYNARTNPAWEIRATVTKDETDALMALPVEGRTPEEWLRAAAMEWAGSFRGSVIRHLGGGKGGFEHGMRALARGVQAGFDSWARKAGRIIELAATGAMHASSREFNRALIHPARRARVA